MLYKTHHFTTLNLYIPSIFCQKKNPIFSRAQPWYQKSTTKITNPTPKPRKKQKRNMKLVNKTIKTLPKTNKWAKQFFKN